jgi:hypothetical protein
MIFGAIADRGDSWEVQVPDAEVARVSFDWAVTLLVASVDRSMEVRIENEFSIARPDGKAISVDPEGEVSQLANALTLLRGKIDSLHTLKTGSLEILFTDGRLTTVPVSDECEAWGISTSQGPLVVCMPGGELAIWSR